MLVRWQLSWRRPVWFGQRPLTWNDIWSSLTPISLWDWRRDRHCGRLLSEVSQRDQNPHKGFRVQGFRPKDRKRSLLLNETFLDSSEFLHTPCKSAKANVESLILKCDLVLVIPPTDSGIISICYWRMKWSKLASSVLQTLDVWWCRWSRGFRNTWNLKTPNCAPAMLQLFYKTYF